MAAIEAARNPGASYKPLFLYGGVGLGKTHLLHAIGNLLLEVKPNARIRYIHAEQYASDVVHAYQEKAFDRFRRYYHSLNLLLLDDIEFLSGKSRTQEELFFAFDALSRSKAQIIITGGTRPQEMIGIDDHLVSRFDSGLVLEIKPPEFEMRLVIVKEMAARIGVQLGDDVLLFMVAHLPANAQALAGALHKIVLFARFHERKITLELAQEALMN